MTSAVTQLLKNAGIEQKTFTVRISNLQTEVTDRK